MIFVFLNNKMIQKIIILIFKIRMRQDIKEKSNQTYHFSSGTNLVELTKLRLDGPKLSFLALGGLNHKILPLETNF